MFVCGICKHEKLQREGHLFHSCNDWLHIRLFICSECLEGIALQRSLHELCYECDEHNMSAADYFDLSKPRLKTHLDDLIEAIEMFDKAHAGLFEKLPFTTDRDCVHPGSTEPNLKKMAREVYALTPI